MRTAFIWRGAIAAILLASSVGVVAAQTTGPIEFCKPEWFGHSATRADVRAEKRNPESGRR